MRAIQKHEWKMLCFCCTAGLGLNQAQHLTFAYGIKNNRFVQYKSYLEIKRIIHWLLISKQTSQTLHPCPLTWPNHRGAANGKRQQLISTGPFVPSAKVPLKAFSVLTKLRFKDRSNLENSMNASKRSAPVLPKRLVSILAKSTINKLCL